MSTTYVQMNVKMTFKSSLKYLSIAQLYFIYTTIYIMKNLLSRKLTPIRIIIFKRVKSSEGFSTFAISSQIWSHFAWF